MPFSKKKDDFKPIDDEEYLRNKIRKELEDKRLIRNDISHRDTLTRRLSIIAWDMSEKEFHALSFVVAMMFAAIGFFYFEMLYIAVMFFLLGLTTPFMVAWALESRVMKRMNKSLKKFMDRLSENVMASSNSLDLFDRTCDQLDEPFRSVIGDVVGRSKTGSVDFTEELFAVAKHIQNKYLIVLAANLVRQKEDGQPLKDVIKMVADIVDTSEKIASSGRKMRIGAAVQGLLFIVLFFISLVIYKTLLPGLYYHMISSYIGSFIYKLSFVLVICGIAVHIVFGRR
jgi:Flp pilus assembly protein TadB